ncbi:3'(2'),5'-bisphosphate nucleotidase CysQ [Sphingosinicella sp.]|uniref:3'(2'),5'-bisphosphate nucleotidase CysQ n=1 Tax=Sphingosinicella sp. TaxID=1917971 RepID=UPI004037BFA3
MTDEDLAAHLADGAGRLLMGLREGPLATDAGLGLIADKAANSFILTALAEWRPGDAVLSEECPDDPARTACSRCWIIDPLDGTREYGEGRNDWAVHIALSVDGRPAVGAVALPALGRLYRSDGPPATAPDRERPVIAVSRTRPPEIALALAAGLDAELKEMGSAGAKAMAVVGGEADLYVHAGGQHQWDNCAPAAVALGLGLHASRIDGAPLVYNGPDTNVPDLLIGRPDLAARAITFVTGRR